MKTELFIEFQGKKTDQKFLLESVKEIWRGQGNLIKDLNTIELFFKPDENKCYYVINKEVSGSFDV